MVVRLDGCAVPAKPLRSARGGRRAAGAVLDDLGPAEGEFPIRAYVAALRDAGYAGPWGVEVLSEDLRALPIEEIFDCASATSRAQLD